MSTNNTDGAALEPVTVTQADREAAAEYMRLFPDLRLPEAFARHRQSHSLPGAVGMREALTLARNHIEQNAPCDGTLEIIDAALTPSAISDDAFGLTDDEAWEQLVNFDDRTSPAEYPDMALITREELSHFMRSSAVCELGDDLSDDAGEAALSSPTPDRIGKDAVREALERISKLTPFSANAATAEDFAATVHAIADTALSATPAQEGEP